VTSIRPHATALVLLLALVACDVIPIARPVGPMFGFVVMGEYGTGLDDQQVFGHGAFVAFAEPPSGAFLNDPYASLRGTCEILDLEDVAELPEVPLPEVAYVQIDAGATLPLRSPAGRYADLERIEGRLGREVTIAYAVREPVIGRLPDGLTLDVPGAVFPRFADEPFPALTPFELEAPAAQDLDAITTSTRFEWEASGSEQAVVALTVVSRAQQLLVRCYAADEGSFAFPSDAAQALGPEFVGHLSTVGRIGYRLATQRDAVLLLATTRTRAFVFRPEPPPVP
jgi:hypothetical protein